MKIYTKGGDAGQTSLYGGRRISKDDLRIEAYGTIDELNSHVGHLIAVCGLVDQKMLMTDVQNRLFTIGSNLASDPEKNLPVPDLKEADIEALEAAMDNMDIHLQPLKAFVLPGGSVPNAVAHVCRTVTRRAERRMVSLAQVSDLDQILIKYVNRLSDYFFVLSRYIAHDLQHEEIPWIARKS